MSPVSLAGGCSLLGVEVYLHNGLLVWRRGCIFFEYRR
jgi:hypothetical protein